MLDWTKLYPHQAMAANMLFRYRRLMLVLPRQFGGKTELGIRLVEDCMDTRDSRTGLFLAKDTKSARRATREKFLRVFDPSVYSVNSDRIISRRNPRSAVNIASMDRDPDRIRGGTNHIIHGSEVAFWKLDHGETIPGAFGKIIDPTTVINNAYVFLETTLNGQNGFKDLWDNYKEFGFARLLLSLSMLLEMGIVSQEEYDRVKQQTHPLIWRQEFECEFITFRGRAYDEFDEALHVAEVEPPKDWQRVVFAADWGWDPSATCALFGYVEDGHLFIFDEIYEKQLRLKDFHTHMQARIERWQIAHLAGVADHEEDRIEELNRRGIPCGKARKSNVLGNRIEIKERLWKGEITIDPRCQNLIRDLLAATWHPKKEGELDDSQCTWGHFDAEASLRYLVRELGKFEVDEPEENPQTDLDQASARAWELTRMRGDY